jgi:glycosyltransferase involved in cell wall biosynthesis
LHVAILTHAISTFGHEYARAFAALGHRATVLSLSACDQGPGPVEVRLVGPPGFKPWETSARWPYVQALLRLRRVLRRMQPDILFAVYLTSAGTLACLSGHPKVVVSAQGSDVTNAIGRGVWRRIFRWQARRACAVHAVADHLVRTLVDQARIAPARVVVAPVGVDTARFRLVPPEARPNAGRILCTRAHKPVYDQATLVRAMAHLREARVPFHVTFAHGMMAETTQALVREAALEDRADFLGGYRLDDLPALLAHSDVYVSTSLSDGTSVSLLEALSTGTFPVVSDIPANRPWIRHGVNGLLFPTGDDRALAERLAEALAGAALRAAAAPISRRKAAEEGDLLGGARKLLEVFQRCLAS